MVEIGRDVDKFFGLFLDRFYYGGVAVAGRDDRNTGSKVQEAVVIDRPSPLCLCQDPSQMGNRAGRMGKLRPGRV
jgi:hypothetical protein